ncbi:aminotransferase-like domain-containing protein [Peribacillus frigoritolerans]|uniref:aminotransferase-like domain-containing protein n=1 Tax=Peribacillus frigoritolerans TaxID=450367 RepID=UPI00215B3B96|nr:PLP-dependent aminotransferase family protein [Peribacillus frigoritolerans]MCR8868984.1 PLP-dependent aminotransferase family protein [Peribacillus frigoritolerans]
MNVESFFSENIKAALKNDPPGAWMPDLPDGCIRLSSGYPDPALVPAEELKEAVARLLDEEQDLPLHYLGSPRIPRLKKQIQKRLAERGICVLEEQLLITSGACQGIDLIARVLLDDKAVVAVESPTYMEALEIFQNYTKRIISIPIDEQGLQTYRLKEMLDERKRTGQTLPHFLYTIPTFQNPTGTTMANERREHLLELSIEYDFLVLEDDAYGELAFDENPVPIKSIDKCGRVLQVGSLSKVVAPGMRIGWIAGESEFIKAFEWFKKDLDHPFAQSSMAVYLENTDFEKRLDLLKNTYRSKCTALIHSMEQFLPESVSWYVPDGGYFVWVRIPGADTSLLLSQALANGVSYVPGKYFFLDQNDGTEFLRLSFSYANEKEMIEGIRRLGQLIASSVL